MPEVFDSKLKARLTIDAGNRVRGINHVDEFWSSEQHNPRDAAIAYLRAVADTLDVPTDEFEHAHQPVSYLEPAKRGTEYRLEQEKLHFDATTEAFDQTHLNVPVWGAAITVTVKHNPMRVVSAVNTSLDALDAKLPAQPVIERWRQLIARAAAEQEPIGFDQERRTRSDTAGFVRQLLDARAVRRTATARASSADRAGQRAGRVIRGRFFVYRYDSEKRLPRKEGKPTEPQREGSPGFGEEDERFQGSDREPTLPLPPVDRRIRAGRDYLVCEITFHYPTTEWGDINWLALVELETTSVLYLRALAASVNGLIFLRDPVSKSGSAANGPTATGPTLNGFRDNITLPNLNAPSAGVQSLAGTLASVSEQEPPVIAAPTQAVGTNFDYDVITDNFSAVSAYYHTDRFFALMESLGFTLAGYFPNTTFPVPVDHRGLGTMVNAHCVGNGTGGIGHLCYALAHSASQVGIATDWRVHLHELGGHGVLYEHVNSANFGFSHSAGDSLAVILNDPDSQAPDRFVLAPFVPQVVRRHDRSVASWAWGGPNDLGSYSSEQILATTLFRIYRSIGGDATDVNRKRFGARMMAYLILRTISTLTPGTNPASALAFANALIAVDPLNWTSEGVFGGAYGKVMRWSFEKQGLYQPGTPAAGTVATEGQAPAVDVYIDDGRGGEYQYQPVHWQTTTIWNRHAADGLVGHEEPILGATNYAYVKAKNRGTQLANNVVVRGFHTKPMAGLLWPDDFEAFTTAQISVGTLGANNTEEKVVGPFSWTPNINAYGHDCILMIVSATSDPSNVDNFTAGEVMPEWRLVPNDNNIGQRNVQPVPGGKLDGLLASLNGSSFWVGNPNPSKAVIDVDVRLPRLLAERGWTLSFRGLQSNRFTLEPRRQRELVMDLKPGGAFERGDVEQTSDRNIVLTVTADGGVIGGMTYQLDPAIEWPLNVPGAKQQPADQICAAHARKLLECLNLHGQEVAEVRIKKVTVDIVMEKERD